MNLTIKYTLDAVSLNKFIRKIDEFERKATTFAQGRAPAYRQMLDEAETLMRNRWRTNFNSGGSIYGPWPDLDPDTVAEKKGRGGPLVRTGQMRGKFFSDMYGNKSNRGIEWTFRNYHGLVYHHYGTKGSAQSFPNKYGNAPYVGFAGMHEPARPLTGFNAADSDALRRIVAKHARQFVSIK